MQNKGDKTRLFAVRLEDILDKKNGLYQLANRLNWDYLTRELGPYYAEGPGRPEIPIRVIVGLHYLKYLENESDESVVQKFCENPYWQYFCGLEILSTSITLSSNNMSKMAQANWRKRG